MSVRIGELTPMLEQVFGRHWQVQLARLIDMDVTTVNKWARERRPPPPWLHVLVWALVQLQRNGVAIPQSLDGLELPAEGED